MYKPDRVLYLKVAERLGVSPQEAIAFEDSPNFVLAAKRAGLYCVTVPNPLPRSGTAYQDIHGRLIIPHSTFLPLSLRNHRSWIRKYDLEHLPKAQKSWKMR